MKLNFNKNELCFFKFFCVFVMILHFSTNQEILSKDSSLVFSNLPEESFKNFETNKL